jgi:hypothetical protein
LVVETISVPFVTDPLSYVYDEPNYDYQVAILVILINVTDDVYLENFLLSDFGYKLGELYNTQKLFTDGHCCLNFNNLHTINDAVNIVRLN